VGQKCTPDIISPLGHAGFQRLDGRNLMGFNDGVSDPAPGNGAF
jgi:deferrochelatase/peroxidase EfeB